MKTVTRILAAIAAASALQAFAQGYPNRPVHVIITFPPGTGTDIVDRTVTQKLSEFWGQPVLAENRPGAGGSIGAALVAKAAPDGYTLMIDSNAHVVTPAIYSKLPYDTLKDFVDIAPLAGGPNVLVAGPGSNVKSVAELIAEAKANPGQVNFASAGIGSGTHLNLEKFKLAAGIDVTHVPYKGTPEVVSDLLGKRVNYYFAPISPAIPLIRDGRLRALAVSSAKRSDQLPDVPRVAGSGRDARGHCGQDLEGREPRADRRRRARAARQARQRHDDHVPGRVQPTGAQGARRLRAHHQGGGDQ